MFFKFKFNWKLKACQLKKNYFVMFLFFLMRGIVNYLKNLCKLSQKLYNFAIIYFLL